MLDVGIPNEWFALVSTPSVQVNGLFTYIHKGRTDYNHTHAFSHAGTYISELAIRLDNKHEREREREK